MIRRILSAISAAFTIPHKPGRRGVLRAVVAAPIAASLAPLIKLAPPIVAKAPFSPLNAADVDDLVLSTLHAMRTSAMADLARGLESAAWGWPQEPNIGVQHWLSPAATSSDV